MRTLVNASRVCTRAYTQSATPSFLRCRTVHSPHLSGFRSALSPVRHNPSPDPPVKDGRSQQTCYRKGSAGAKEQDCGISLVPVAHPVRAEPEFISASSWSCGAFHYPRKPNFDFQAWSVIRNDPLKSEFRAGKLEVPRKPQDCNSIRQLPLSAQSERCTSIT